MVAITHPFPHDGWGPSGVPHDASGPRIAGVALEIADRTGLDPDYVRTMFVLATALGGLGAVAYVVAWVVRRARARP